jgi:hypothetical protein
MNGERRLRALMEYGEEAGCINMSAFNALVQELELDDEELSGLSSSRSRSVASS